MVFAFLSRLQLPKTWRQNPWPWVYIAFAILAFLGLRLGAATLALFLTLTLLCGTLLGLHDLGPGLARWLAVDVVWAVLGGLAVGAGLGVAVGRLVVYLRRTTHHHRRCLSASRRPRQSETKPEA